MTADVFFRAIRKFDEMAFDAVVAELGRSDYNVKPTKGKHSNEYTVSKNWTAKGVRSYAALDSLTGNLWCEIAELEESEEGTS